MPEQLLSPTIGTRYGVPYGGTFILNRPDLGMVGEGYNFDLLCAVIRKYRIANAIPIGLEFEQEVAREVCKLYPQECRESHPQVPNRTKIGWEDVLRFTQVMISHWKNRGQLVPDEEAHRRAEICSRCDNNAPIGYSCAGKCGALPAFVRVLVGSKSTPHDAKLQQCAICACSLESAVWVPLEAQWTPLSETQKAQFKLAKETYGCWKHRE